MASRRTYTHRVVDDAVQTRLDRGGVVEITTTGRRSGLPRRIEVTLQPLDGAFYISSRPEGPRRSWYENLMARPELILHLGEDAQASLSARTRAIEGETERRRVLTPIVSRMYELGRLPTQNVEEWIERSPLVELTFL